MGASKLIAVMALAALGLAACNNNGRGSASDGAAGICKPFTTPAAQTAGAPAVPGTAVLPAAADASAALDDCLHRWGYTLAASSDPANMVAEATLAACASSLSGWNQQSLTTPGAGGPNMEAPSLINGQTTNPLAEHYAFAQGRALFYVVQARAGHCAPPPASTAPASR